METNLDQIFEEHRKKPYYEKKTPLWRQLHHHLDLMVYKDEAEYLETPGLSMETQFSVVESLSKINNRSGYTAIFLRELHSLIEQIHPYSGKPKLKILDIGAGGGGLLKAIHRWAKHKKIPVELWGLDLSEDFRKETQRRLDHEKFPIRLMQGDACHMKNIEDESFDLVLCNYMVHHLRSASKVASFLKEVYRVSSKGWLIVDFNRKFWGPFFAGVSGFVFGAPWHVNSDGIKSIRRAYKADEMNFIIHKLERAGKIKKMSCRALPLLPYWMIKGRKPVL